MLSSTLVCGTWVPMMPVAAQAQGKVQGDAVAGARAVVRRMGQARTIAQMAPCLTNESAAMMGTMIAIGQMMQYSLAPGTGASARQKAEQAQFETLIRRYGLDKAQNKGPESKEWKRFAAQGRRFLIDLDRLQARSGKASQRTQTRRPVPSADALRYTVLSPTRVALRDPRRTKSPPMEARLEEGKWRLHLPMDTR
jgi:hypothetical protein